MSRAFKPMQIGSIELFCKAAELGSFSAAAEALGVTPASVSRSVSRLEERLGVRLFSRTTRSMRLTTDGQFYKTQCQHALDLISEAERAVTGRQAHPKGQLRVSVGTVYGHHRLLPHLPEFTRAFPDVDLELSVSNRTIDFVEDNFDLAIRLGEPRDSQLIARKLEDASLGVFASPEYLAKRGEPKTIEELNAHDVIQFVSPTDGRPMPWLLRTEAGENIELLLKSRLRVQEDVLAGVRWAVAGGGLFQIYHFVTEEAVRRGKLVEVMHFSAGRSRPYYALYPRNRHLSARVRAFVNFLTETARS